MNFQNKGFTFPSFYYKISSTNRKYPLNLFRRYIMKTDFIKTQINQLEDELLIVENLIEDLGEMPELLDREAELKFALNEFLGELS